MGKIMRLLSLLSAPPFFLWGFCNGMIDVLNKHFQNSLHISKAESGFLQFANFIGYFVMAIVGGAIMPFMMGWLADTFSMRIGFIMPLICFVYILFYAALWPTLENRDKTAPVHS
jgi:fucose permease